MTSFLIFGFISSIIITILCGALISSIGRYKSIYLGIIIFLSLIIPAGLILSFFDYFNQLSITLIFSLSFIVLSIVYLYNSNLKYSKDSKLINKNLILSYKRIIIFLFILSIIILSAFYSFHSSFPMGHDRGRHFGNTIFLIENNHLTPVEPGSVHYPFYFQGPNILITSYTLLGSALSGHYLPNGFQNFEEIKIISFLFKLFVIFFLILSVIGFYNLTKKLFKSSFITIFSLFILSILSFGYVTIGSIGMMMTLVFIPPLIIISYELYLSEVTYFRNYLSLFFIINSLMFLHIISATLSITFLFILLIFRYKFKKSKLAFKIVLTILLAGTLNLVLLLSYREFIIGFIQEVFRKLNSNGGTYAVSGSTYLGENLNQIMSLGPIILSILPFIVLGFFYKLSKNSEGKKISLILLVTSLIFIIFPILGLPKAIAYLIFPFSIIGALGFNYLNSKKLQLISTLAISLIMIMSFSYGLMLVDKEAESKLYDLEEDYKNIYAISSFIQQNTTGDFNVLFPDSGARSYFIYSLNPTKVLFAEPRYSDVPSYLELSKVYSSFPTNVKIFDYSDVSLSERLEILDKYNIGMIIDYPGKRVPDEISKNHDLIYFQGNYRGIILK